MQLLSKHDAQVPQSLTFHLRYQSLTEVSQPAEDGRRPSSLGEDQQCHRGVDAPGTPRDPAVLEGKPDRNQC